MNRRSLVLKETGSFVGLYHLFHFLELILISVVELGRRGWHPHDIRYLSIPQWPDGSWKGKVHPHNQWIVSRVFPNAEVVYHEDLDQKVVVDRGECDQGSINKAWAKHIRDFDPYHWNSLLGLDADPAGESGGNKPVVTYVDRQGAGNRILSQSDHDALVDCLQSNADITFRGVALETLRFEEQVQITAGTDLLIGVHGNGLSHAAFMKPGRSVCEIFVPGKMFYWDYYTLSKMMGHEYLCVYNGKPMFPPMFNLQRRECGPGDLDLAPIQGMIRQIMQEK